ncbi:hypothetical protein GCM10011405_01460 [Rufibacter glacialis]|nr:hypothetical protein GCM10011405_01460 [Rufibacter glacialis]
MKQQISTSVIGDADLSSVTSNFSLRDRFLESVLKVGTDVENRSVHERKKLTNTKKYYYEKAKFDIQPDVLSVCCFQ